MRSRGTLILMAAALALVAFYTLVERPRRRREALEEARRDDLTPLEVADVAAVWIERADGRLALEVRDTHWEITAPFADLAEPGVVGQLIAAAAGARVFRDLGPRTDLETFGLAPPACVLTMASESGDTLLQLDLGGYTVDRSWVYARRGPDVLLVPTDLRRYSMREKDDFRSRRVVNFDLGVVDAFTVRSGPRAMTWYRRGESEWYTLRDGDTIRGNATAVEAPMRRLRGLRARRFPPAREAAAALSGSDWSVEILKRPPAPPVRIRVARGGVGSAYARVSGEDRYTEIDSSVAAVFRLAVSDMRDRRLLSFDPDSVAKVVITAPDTTATIVRTGDGWGSPNPSFGPLVGKRMTAFLRQLQRLTFLTVASERPPAAPWEGGGAFALVLRDAGGTIIDEIRWRRSRTPERLEVTGRSMGLVAEVAEVELEAVITSLRHLRD